MKFVIQKYKFQLLLFLIFILAEVLVWPAGEFPLNDDWSYSKSVLILLKEGDIYIGTWCAMTLASHVLWGFGFVKLLGFSFFALRLSNLFSSMLGILIINHLSFKFSNNKVMAFTVSLTLLFNPIYFNLSNTFMTDINFNTWLLCCIYLIYLFLEKKSWIYLPIFIVMSIALILNRQFGIVVPLSFIIASFFLKEKRWLLVISAILSFVIVYLSLKWYESYLSHSIPHWSAYKYSKDSFQLNATFLNKLWNNFNNRHKIIISDVLVYLSPISFLVMPYLFKMFGKIKLLFILVLSAYIVKSYFYEAPLLFGNIFTNMSLGPETFFDSHQGHLLSDQFDRIAHVLKFILLMISITSLICYAFKFNHFNEEIENIGVLLVFLMMLIFIYLLLIFIAESFFDRYYLPLVSLLALLFSLVFKRSEVKMLYAFPVLLLLFYVSVFGTKDYFTLNRAKWKAVNELRQQKGVELKKINAGFEVSCWNEGEYSWWQDYTQLNEIDYLIQYTPQNGFKLLKEFEFQRYFPYKKDKINIFVRDSIK